MRTWIVTLAVVMLGILDLEMGTRSNRDPRNADRSTPDMGVAVAQDGGTPVPPPPKP